jgi:hypothetical protein
MLHVRRTGQVIPESNDVGYCPPEPPRGDGLDKLERLPGYAPASMAAQNSPSRYVPEQIAE